MRKPTIHARIELALATVLLLGSCGSDGFDYQFSDAERDEIADVVAEVAYDTVPEHQTI